MTAGKRNCRLELQRRTTARDGVGEPIETWATYDTVWAQRIGGVGGERVVGQQVTGRSGGVFNILYRNPEPTISERVKFKSATFDINDVENVEQRNRELLLTVTEVV